MSLCYLHTKNKVIFAGIKTTETMFIKLCRHIILPILVLFCFQYQTRAEHTLTKTDSVLRSYFLKCKAEINSPAFLQINDTLAHLSKQKKDRHMEAVAASLKLDYYYYKNDLDSILIEVENVKKISKQNGQLKYFYFAWGSRLIIYYIKQHQTSTAIYEAQKMLRSAEADNFIPGIVQCYRALATIYMTQSNPKLAYENFKKQIELIEQNGIEDINLPTQYASLAQCALELHQPEDAKKALDEGSKKIKSAYQNFTINKAYILYYIETKEYDKAKKILRKMEQLFEEDKTLTIYRNGLYYVQTEYYLATGEYNKALEVIDRIKADSLSSNKYLNYSITQKEGNIYWAMNDRARAAQFYRDYILATDSIRTQEIQNSTSEFYAILEVEQLQKEKSDLLLHMQEEKLQTIYTILISLVVVLLVVAMMFCRISKLNQKLKKSEAIVVQQNKELTENGEELRKAKERAETASQMKTTFIQSMSHEIRTPLNAIVGFSQVLSAYFKNEDETKEYASIIETSSTNLLRLVSDVLDISYLDQSEELPYNKPDDINNCCQTSIERSRDSVKPGVSLYFEPQCRRLTILTNPTRVAQVLTHLLHNAAKFTDRGSIILAYTIAESPSRIIYTVTDTGKGIPAEQQEYVFERFAKLNDFSQGTGLGLPICRIIAEKLGGSLIIDKEYTGGCRFIFTLPLIRANV